jgi:hypothetical protein
MATITGTAPLTWDAFNSIPIGTRIFNGNADQCVALANLYHQGVNGGSFVPVGSAFQWWTNFSLYSTLTSLYTKIGASQDPQPGDIFIAIGGVYNNEHGHIGVVNTKFDGSTFGTIEQNTEVNRFYGKARRSKANMLGYLRPKNNKAGGEIQLTPEQAQQLAAIYNAMFDANTGVQRRLSDIRTDVASIRSTVSQRIAKTQGGVPVNRSQVEELSATNNLVFATYNLMDDLLEALEDLGQNPQLPPQVDYERIENAMRTYLNTTRLIEFTP